MLGFYRMKALAALNHQRHNGAAAKFAKQQL
jgi:hypothetical protein